MKSKKHIAVSIFLIIPYLILVAFSITVPLYIACLVTVMMWLGLCNFIVNDTTPSELDELREIADAAKHPTMDKFYIVHKDVFKELIALKKELKKK